MCARDRERENAVRDDEGIVFTDTETRNAMRRNMASQPGVVHMHVEYKDTESDMVNEKRSMRRSAKKHQRTRKQRSE